MKTLTAKTPQEVMWWIETHPHHIASTDIKRNHFTLKGHTHTLHVPNHIWPYCHTQSSEEFDIRMYRWDHRAHCRYDTTIAEWKKRNPSREIPLVGELFFIERDRYKYHGVIATRADCTKGEAHLRVSVRFFPREVNRKTIELENEWFLVTELAYRRSTNPKNNTWVVLEPMIQAS